MILTGPQIEREVEAGRITISPFARAQLNPNSYNYRIAPRLRVHRTHAIDVHADHPLDEFTIPASGVVLEPGRIYLGTTVERIGSTCFVPALIGRSSLGRIGVFLQYSADMGNLGACHQWTLEIEVVERTRIYPGDLMGQMTFTATTGSVALYGGHFGRIDEPTAPPRELLTALA
ncbi:deoxycytidine deaminase [Kitasatospora sp. NBC_01287]|uniref:dCTP deaminase n=1 Tax=Kitasatospora sp. NBC_01287 TaxID=2903573 RepID=UPI00225B63E3|nr:deoxycytidine deaminase [Kitasatospora sp. NBC_01287]MCX4749194.1 deoxycytidine deaminase [Kitasatospora sp. NBC_01287]